MKYINIGILAHVDAGKTTVTEGLLVHSGVRQHMGRVDEGTTHTDAMPLEKQRGITIRSAAVSIPWQGVKINLIDTPGHMDFIAEVERSLAVLDGVVLVVSAKEGVQTQTRTLFRKLRSMRVPILLFINKIDRTGVSLDTVYADIREKLTSQIVAMQGAHSVGTRDADIYALDMMSGTLYDTIVASSDALLEVYLAGQTITADDCTSALRQMTAQGHLLPVFLGAALRDIGIPQLLDAIVTYFSGGGDAGLPLSAYVFKVEWDTSGHKRLYLRVFAGVLYLRGRVAAGALEALQIKGLLAMRQGGFVPADRIEAGDIGILLDAPHIQCGDFIGSKPTWWRELTQTPPLLTVSIAPVNAAERSLLLSCLQRLTEEDPALRFSIKPDTGEIFVRLYGVLQHEIIQALILERFGLLTVFSPMQTLMKEKPLRAGGAEIRIGAKGNLHEAGIALSVEPLPEGSGNQYESEVSYGDLEKPFQNAVAEGVWAALQEGLGFEMTDTKVVFKDMDYSSVTSTPADFRRLAPQVLKKALETTGLQRMEPWLRFTLITPVESQKKVLAAVNTLVAIIEDVTYSDIECTVRGEVTLDSSKDFMATLQSLTQGKAEFMTSFLAYRYL